MLPFDGIQLFELYIVYVVVDLLRLLANAIFASTLGRMLYTDYS